MNRQQFHSRRILYWCSTLLLVLGLAAMVRADQPKYTVGEFAIGVRFECAVYHPDGIRHILAPNGDVLVTLDPNGRVLSIGNDTYSLPTKPNSTPTLESTLPYTNILPNKRQLRAQRVNRITEKLVWTVFAVDSIASYLAEQKGYEEVGIVPSKVGSTGMLAVNGIVLGSRRLLDWRFPYLKWWILDAIFILGKSIVIFNNYHTVR